MPCLKYFNKEKKTWEPLGLTFYMDAENSGLVSYNVPQNLTEEQKAVARENIGASSLTIKETEGGLVLTEDSTSTT